MDLVKRDRSDLVDVVRRLFTSDWEDSSWLRVEEFVDGASQVVRVEVPGIDPEKDVEISVVNGTLRISATKQEKSEHKDKDSYRSEFHYGSFVRSVALPKGCTESDVTATYRDGVLDVRIPMGEAPQPKPVKIPVTRG
jgi:HSP20 family protein